MKSLPPGAARILPTEARIRQVEAASEARNTHFSHMSCMMLFAGRGAEIAAGHHLGDGADPVRQLAVALAEGQRLHRLSCTTSRVLVERHRDRA